MAAGKKLKLDTSKPYYNECFNEGVDAFHTDKPCPYKQAYKKQAWQDGWDYEMAEHTNSGRDMPLFKRLELLNSSVPIEEIYRIEEEHRRTNRARTSDRAKALNRNNRIDEVLKDD